jgi:hypothetical protein
VERGAENLGRGGEGWGGVGRGWGLWSGRGQPPRYPAYVRTLRMLWRRRRRLRSATTTTAAGPRFRVPHPTPRIRARVEDEAKTMTTAAVILTYAATTVQVASSHRASGKFSVVTSTASAVAALADVSKASVHEGSGSPCGGGKQGGSRQTRHFGASAATTHHRVGAAQRGGQRRIDLWPHKHNALCLERAAGCIMFRSA